MTHLKPAAVDDISETTLRRIADLAADLAFDGTVLLDTSGAGQAQMLQDIADIAVQVFLAASAALDPSEIRPPLPAVPRQRASDDSPSRLRGA